MTHKILVVNPGSTSTKIAIYEAVSDTAEQETAQPLSEVFSETLRHDAEELQKLGNIADQLDFRKQILVGNDYHHIPLIHYGL